jgi:hypothetical protein
MQCVGCSRTTVNRACAAGVDVPACSAKCYSASQRCLQVRKITDSERRGAQLLPTQLRRVLPVDASVPVLAYVPDRPYTVPIATDGPAIYLQAHRAPDGSLVVDRFDNYTTPGHTWRATLVKAVPTRSAPAAVHATPPPPAPAPTPLPELGLSFRPLDAPDQSTRTAFVPLGASVAMLYRARERGVGACGHRATLEWAGSATQAPQAFCGTECAQRALGAPVRVVENIGARLLAEATAAHVEGFVALPPHSPLLRVYAHHPHAAPAEPHLMTHELARAAAACIGARSVVLPTQPIAAITKQTPSRGRAAVPPSDLAAAARSSIPSDSDSDTDSDTSFRDSDDEPPLFSTLPAPTPAPFAPSDSPARSPVTFDSPARSPLMSPSGGGGGAPTPTPFAPFDSPARSPGVVYVPLDQSDMFPAGAVPLSSLSSSGSGPAFKRAADAAMLSLPPAKTSLVDPLAGVPASVLAAAAEAASRVAAVRIHEIKEHADRAVSEYVRQWSAGAVDAERMRFVVQLVRDKFDSVALDIVRATPAVLATRDDDDDGGTFIAPRLVGAAKATAASAEGTDRLRPFVALMPSDVAGATLTEALRGNLRTLAELLIARMTPADIRTAVLPSRAANDTVKWFRETYGAARAPAAAAAGVSKARVKELLKADDVDEFARVVTDPELQIDDHSLLFNAVRFRASRILAHVLMSPSVDVNESAGTKYPTVLAMALGASEQAETIPNTPAWKKLRDTLSVLILAGANVTARSVAKMAWLRMWNLVFIMLVNQYHSLQVDERKKLDRDAGKDSLIEAMRTPDAQGDMALHHAARFFPHIEEKQAIELVEYIKLKAPSTVFARNNAGALPGDLASPDNRALFGSVVPATTLAPASRTPSIVAPVAYATDDEIKDAIKANRREMFARLKILNYNMLVDGMPLLFYAADQQSDFIVEYLVERGARLEFGGETVLTHVLEDAERDADNDDIESRKTFISSILPSLMPSRRNVFSLARLGMWSDVINALAANEALVSKSDPLLVILANANADDASQAIDLLDTIVEILKLGVGTRISRKERRKLIEFASDINDDTRDILEEVQNKLGKFIEDADEYEFEGDDAPFSPAASAAAAPAAPSIDAIRQELAYDNPESFKRLNIADPNMLIDGVPLLFFAADNNYRRIVEHLLNRGDVRLVFKNQTVLDYLLEGAESAASDDEPMESHKTTISIMLRLFVPSADDLYALARIGMWDEVVRVLNKHPQLRKDIANNGKELFDEFARAKAGENNADDEAATALLKIFIKLLELGVGDYILRDYRKSFEKLARNKENKLSPIGALDRLQNDLEEYNANVRDVDDM